MAKFSFERLAGKMLSNKPQANAAVAENALDDNYEQATLDDTAKQERPTPADEEPTPAPAANSKKALPPFAIPAARWFATAIFLLLAIDYVPSVASLALITAAALACPLKAIRNLGPISRLEGMLPERIPTTVGMAALSALLAVLGLSVTPAKGGYTLNTYLDLRSVALSQPDPIEYDIKTIDVADLLSSNNPNVVISAQDPINAAVVGEQTLAVDVSEGPFQKTESVTFVVQDTQPPLISLTTSKRSVMLGEPIDLTAYFTVEDPVDGALPQVQEKPQARGTSVGLEQFYDTGWFMVDDSDVNLQKPGTYEVIVYAADQHGNEDTGKFDVIILDPLDGAELTPSTNVLEYSNKTTDPTKLVTCSVDGVNITATELDLSKVGTQKVTYTLTKGTSTKTVPVAFTVKDTKGPSIEIASDSPTITEGDAFDPYGNVSSVTDPVDGELPRVDAKPDGNGDGWYTVEGDYDAGKEGVYFLTVVACDRNGNQKTKEFTLTVNEAPKPVVEESAAEEPTAQPADNAKDYVVNTNTGKFHRTNCRYVDTIADHNRWDAHIERQELIDQGYEPCKVCKP